MSQEVVWQVGKKEKKQREKKGKNVNIMSTNAFQVSPLL